MMQCPDGIYVAGNHIFDADTPALNNCFIANVKAGNIIVPLMGVVWR